MPARRIKPVEIYQIKVTLRGSHPPIWRRIQVRSDITLAKLHRILQCVMGWQDSHMHQFVIQDQRYGVPDEDDADHGKRGRTRPQPLPAIPHVPAAWSPLWLG